MNIMTLQKAAGAALLMLAVWLAGCQTVNKDRTDALSEAVLDHIRSILGGAGESAIVAHVVQVDGVTMPQHVWAIDHSFPEARPVDHGAYYEGIGKDRARWPRKFFVFLVVEEQFLTARVLLVQHYNVGNMEFTRGGNSRYLDLTRRPSRWHVTRDTPEEFWD